MTTKQGPATARRAAIYARISEDRNGDGLGVERQGRDCRRLARDHGYRVVGTYTDNDLSASSGKRRPAYARLLADLADGQVDVVIAWHPDRLYRRPRDLEEFIEAVEAARATVATVKAGDMDLATASGRMVARMLGAAARHEVELKAERQRAKHRELAEAGLPAGGGSRGFGYAADRVTLVPDEAEVIRSGAARILGGASLRSTTADWNARGSRTPSGRTWYPSAVRRVLTSARIAGLRVADGETFDAIWPAIVTRAEHERLVAILTDPARRLNGGRTARSYLLTGGVAVCGRCGTRLVARPNEAGKRRYACTIEAGGCGRLFHLARTLEEYVGERVVEALASRDLDRIRRASAADDQGAGAAADELASVSARRDALAASYADGGLSLAAFGAADRKLEARVEELRARLARLDRSTFVLELPTGPDELAAAWAAASLEQRRGIVASVLERVTIAPGVPGRNRFDPDRVAITWRSG